MTQFNKQWDAHYSPSLLLCTVYLLHIPAYIIILLYIKSTVYCSAHFILLHILFFLIFIFHLYLCIFSCVVLHILHCPLSGPDLIYISLLIIFCIIDYVMNKTLNLEEGMMSRKAFNNVYRRCLAQPHVVLFFPPLLTVHVFACMKLGMNV